MDEDQPRDILVRRIDEAVGFAVTALGSAHVGSQPRLEVLQDVLHPRLQSSCVVAARALLLFLAVHGVSHPEIIVVLAYKVVAAFPTYTVWAGVRMLSQA